MPIQIIDGFKLGTSKPIDDRIVGSGSSNRDNITYKYDGLLVVDTNDHKPYIWNSNNSTWSEVAPANNNNNNNNNNGSGSSITELTLNNKKYYYIGTNPSTVNSSDLSLNITGGLNVNGDIKILNGKFIGDGNSITSINPANISSSGAQANQVLQLIGNNLTPTWTTISSNKINTALVDNSKNYFIGFIENTPVDVSTIRNKSGVGIQNNVFYLTDGVGLSASVGTFSRVFVTGLSASVGTFSRVFVTGLSASVGTFSYAFATGLSASVGTFSYAFATGLSASVGTFSRVFSTNGTFSTFQIPSTTSNKMVLTSDSTGVASWAAVPPVGSIIIWSWHITVPNDYKICSAAAGYIFINNAYYEIPNLNDKIISGVNAITSIDVYGSQSPTAAGSITIGSANLPRHTHGPGTLNITHSGTHSHGITTRGFTSGGGTSAASTQTPTNSSTNTNSSGHTHPSNSFSGSTDNGGFANTPISLPIINGMKVVFLIKFNPGAAPGTNGHYTLNKISGYTYKTIKGVAVP